MSKKLKPREDPEIFVQCLTYNLKDNYNIPISLIKVYIGALAFNGILTFDDLIKVNDEDFEKIKGIGPKIAYILIMMKEHEIYIKEHPFRVKWFRFKKFLKRLIFGTEVCHD